MNAKSFRHALLTCGGVALALAASLAADDRAILMRSADKPYVFVFFDTSGSMNWQPGGDNFAPANADDPASKLYQAKSALYRVLADPRLDGIRWGFGSYNQDSVRAYHKHWLYQPRVNPTWAASLPHPQLGRFQTFGDNCYDDNDGDTACEYDFPGTIQDDLGSCGTRQDLGNALDLLETMTWPVTGDAGSRTSRQWITWGGRRWRLNWRLPTPSQLGGDSVDVELTALRFSDTSCAVIDFNQTQTITFDRVILTDAAGRAIAGSSQFVSWELRDTTPPAPATPDPWPGGNVLQDTGATNTCQGLDLNTDTASDRMSATYNFKTTTIDDPWNRHATALDRGDFVPLDWRDTTTTSSGTVGWLAPATQASHRLANKDFILRKLAPNHSPSMVGFPELRTSPYYQDHPLAVQPLNGTSGLVIAPSTDNIYANVPPLLASGSTPLGNSLRNFRDWFDLWKPLASAPVTSGGDSKFRCRSVNTIFLTDGDETCFDTSLGQGPTPFDLSYPRNNQVPKQDGGGDASPCWLSYQLWKQNAQGGTADPRNVRTFVIGFGLSADPNNFLNCMAFYGGTGAVDYDNDGSIDGPGVLNPNSEDELVGALTDIVSRIRSGAASFASAAVPSVQADALDAVVLTEFTPVGDRRVWPGTIFSYVKPVPIGANGKPVPTPCSATQKSACLAWEAQDVVVEEQVKPSSAAPIGNAANQRRIYYTENGGLGVPLQRHFLLSDVGVPAPQKYDLWGGLRIAFTPGNAASETAALNKTAQVLGEMVALKQVLPPGGSLIEYVIGDNFHSDPLAIGGPSSSLYFQFDIGSDLDSSCSGPLAEGQRSYRQFTLQQQRRRRVLALGTNDGMLHLFDSGSFRWTPGDLSQAGAFDAGSGRELLALVPRTVLPQIVELYDPTLVSNDPLYTVDGRTNAADVLIDSEHSGLGSGDPPSACERGWRTVLFGGLREGGALATDAERPAGVTAAANYPAGSYYALDVTQPDPVVNLRSAGPGLPFYVPSTNNATASPIAAGDPPVCVGDAEGGGLPSGCGPVAFGSVLWEFRDSLDGVRLDEDNNLHVDLAQTWGTPSPGRIRVCTANCADGVPSNDVLEDRYVTALTGGIDPANPRTRGNWLYLVDVETGEAIYKQRLFAAAPAEPAAVDVDFDGYLDRVYIGDVSGLLYRLDLQQTDASGNVSYPRLATFVLQETDRAGVVHFRDTVRISDPAYRPRVLFSATADGASTTVDASLNSATPRPIFFQPSVIFVPGIEQYALAFGTGNRLSLTEGDVADPSGRFFVLLDDFDYATLPIADPSSAVERAKSVAARSALQLINLATAPNANTGVNFLTSRPVHQRGWYMEFDPDDRMIAEPVAISGILGFVIYTPRTVPLDGICEEQGSSQIFGVFVTNANGVLSVAGPPGSGTHIRARSWVTNDLTTGFFLEQRQTANPTDVTATPPPAPSPTQIQIESDIEAEIKQQMGQRCTFPPGYGYIARIRTSVGGFASDSDIRIPQCVIQQGFKEF
jgi:hypothetical protein